MISPVASHDYLDVSADYQKGKRGGWGVGERLEQRVRVRLAVLLNVRVDLGELPIVLRSGWVSVKMPSSSVELRTQTRAWTR